jgi:outer membrane receptor protein involved in Fe transport
MTGYDIYTKINVDKGFIQGYEIQTAYYPTKNFNINVSLTSLYGQSVTRNEPLRRIPPLNGQLGFQYQKGIYHVGFIGDFASAQRRLAQGDKDDNRIQKGGTPGYNVFNCYSGVDLKFMTLKMYLNNILNEDYRTHGSGINGMGRSISLTAVLNLGS